MLGSISIHCVLKSSGVGLGVGVCVCWGGAGVIVWVNVPISVLEAKGVMVNLWVAGFIGVERCVGLEHDTNKIQSRMIEERGVFIDLKM